jgi:peptidoglycan/LPS O-acetylase OafA/YrhL
MLFSIQFLRGIAALLVVLHHTAFKGQIYNTGTLDWLTIGSSGVDLFFIISGFIMCYTTHDKRISIMQFMFQRIKRIIPLYWFFTLLAFIAYIFYPSMVNSSGGTTSVIDSFLLLPTESKYLVQNGWTLSYEFYFYFIFSFIVLLLPVGRWKYAVLCTLLFVLPFLGGRFEAKNIYNQFFFSSWWIEFGYGVLLFLIYKNRFVSLKLGFALLIAAILCLIFINCNSSIVEKFDRAFYIGMPMAMIFYAAISFENCLNNQGNFVSNIFERIGDSSYSLYLSHPFILSPMAIISKKLGINDSFLFGLMLVGPAILTGYLVFIFIEKRILNLTRSKKNKIILV